MAVMKREKIGGVIRDQLGEFRPEYPNPEILSGEMSWEGFNKDRSVKGETMSPSNYGNKK